jgi:hypothetical protein
MIAAKREIKMSEFQAISDGWCHLVGDFPGPTSQFASHSSTRLVCQFVTGPARLQKSQFAVPKI